MGAPQQPLKNNDNIDPDNGRCHLKFFVDMIAVNDALWIGLILT